ncbi:MAG: hypothetical protein N2746_11960 [Deltaproteobacteria bacterium]|nr:hypothetical protein [Deltaproteobacteria bacterium]
MLYSLRRVSESEVAQQRMKIIKFYNVRTPDTLKNLFWISVVVLSGLRMSLNLP